MSENVNFPGARRAGAYVETEDVPDVVPAAPVQARDAAAVEDEAIVEPSWEPSAEVSAAAPTVTTHESEGAAVPASPRGGGAMSVPAPAEVEEDHEPVEPAVEGLRGFLNRVTAGVFKLGPSVREGDTRALVAAQEGFEALIRQSAWTRGVGVLVANKKGTAGKTPTAISLGGVIAAIRGGSVAIGEAADDRGQLAYRAEGEPQLGMGELVANIGAVRTQAQLRGYTVTQTSFASVIGSTPKWRAPLTRQNVLDVAAIVDEHFTVRVWDTGNQYSSGPFSAAVDTSDVLVIPTMNSMDSVFDALELLEFLKAQGGDAARLAETAIVVRLSDGRPEFKAARVKKYFMDQGITEDRIYSLPFDAHIAERGALTLDKLAPATRQALTAVAAGVVAQLNVNVFEKDQQQQIDEGEKR
ncbi:hypothetical protein IV498_10225 [Paenarthrobacter sp. Z7-10]|uniref:MinD/ParA family ATP-binding protein n=1 Tax=Paenarthrobacter sp. Z7-10 TaxID=2787635 RepID=UPI0022A98CE4|nr:hypothetical protein [Paenarthrobacter sp. Z7-10]MCZ2403546.1 hypothetical protein [Paenarthrobacter sp. Z7-10]